MAAVDDSKARQKRLIGRNIRLACQLAGISEYRLALLLNKRPQQMSDWVRGIHGPGVGNLTEIAEKVGRPVWWFYAPHDEDDLTL